MESISIVIPIYNAALTLSELYRQLIPAVEALTECFEIIMVEDCSRDRSWEIICEIARNDSRVRGKRFSRNYGQHNALLCGVRAAKYEIIVTLDDDLQHPVTEISTLLARLHEGYDVVYGSPRLGQHGLWRNLASHIIKLVLRSAMGVQAAREVSAFRVFRTHLRQAFSEYRAPSVSIDVLLTWATARFSSVKVPHAQRFAGQSNYTFTKLLKHAFDILTGYSTLPLQLASVMGFLFTLFGFGILIWVLGVYLVYGTSIPGFSFLASVIAILSGAQLFSLGIFGEYLARMHFRTMDKPTYTISDECGNISDLT